MNELKFFKLETAWVEGKEGHGIGESITFTIRRHSRIWPKLTINGFMIANGYFKNKKLWLANSRVKSMTMYVNDKPYAEIKLNDFYGFQRVTFPDIRIPLDKNVAVKFVIADVYPGEKFSDTSISQVEFMGNGYQD